MNWNKFDEIKPDGDYLILVYRRQLFEICYYEDNELKKPWKYDKHEKPLSNINNSDLYWKKIDNPEKEIKCPFCAEKMKGFELMHYKCKKCNQYFTN